MKVLILGGTGFIGRHLTAGLLKDKHEVAVFHRGKQDVRFRRAVLHIHGNRGQLEEYRRAFRAFSPDVVVDLIAFNGAEARSTVEVFSGQAERLVCASSMDVYQAYGSFRRLEISDPPTRPLSEDAPLRTALFPYRHLAKKENDLFFRYEKIAVEQAVMSDARLPATIVRLPQVYGPFDQQHRLRAYLKHMDAGKDIVMSDAKARWRWTRGYVEDIAAGLALAATNRKASGRIYNIGEREAESEKDWVERIGKAARWTGRLRVVPENALPARLREPYDWNYDLAGDTTRIRRELGYREEVARAEAMRRSVRWERLPS
ncbi:MAG TPA: NAD-dependent epimerase/dehydratase family protein [Chthoniobacterales bacterium]|nr:NAD-dependent epimerase/dehydratase family protein [Chthoniobacterales bacterium]